MLRKLYLATIAIAVPLMEAPSSACGTIVPIDINDIRHADVVVIGRIIHYRIIRDEAFRKTMLANPSLPENIRRFYENKDNGIIGDHARFEVIVDHALKGSVLRKFPVTWNNWTFGEPKNMPRGPFLIALRKTGSPAAIPQRSRGGALRRSIQPSMVMLQAPCSAPFLFPSTGNAANAVRHILSTISK